tara:strand:+ start:1814 stop:2629 length:816 start_codon:yes stop_codon:yes gene_type:complete
MSSDNDFLSSSDYASSDDDKGFLPSSDEEDINETEDINEMEDIRESEEKIKLDFKDEYLQGIFNTQSGEDESEYESEDESQDIKDKINIDIQEEGAGQDDYESQDIKDDVIIDRQQGSDDQMIGQDEQQLKDERGAFDRTSGKHTLLLNCGKYKSNSLSELGIKIREVDLTPQEKIACMISYIQLNNPKLFSQSDTNLILDLIENNEIPSIETKNAIGLMIGYYINPFIKKNKINKRINNEYLRLLMEKENYNITYPDLIRYGRLWSKIKI